MYIKVGDMWTVEVENQIILVTTNCSISCDRLVMGKGAAKEMRDRYFDIGLYWAGKVLREKNEENFYGTLYSPEYRLGIFQVKRDWREPAHLTLIQQSAVQLADLATKFPNDIFNLNFPGIGAGWLRAEDVLPLISPLPDNVVVWVRSLTDLI